MASQYRHFHYIPVMIPMLIWPVDWQSTVMRLLVGQDLIRRQLGWFPKLLEAKCGGILSQSWLLVVTLMTNGVANSWGGDTRPRCLPEGDVGLPISLQIFVAQLARLLLEFWWQNFFLHPPPSGDFVPGQLAVGVWDTNHWAIEEQLKYKREKCGIRKIPVQVYFAGLKINEFWHMSSNVKLWELMCCKLMSCKLMTFTTYEL